MTAHAPRPEDYVGRGRWYTPGKIVVTEAGGGIVDEARQAAKDAHVAALAAHEAALQAQIVAGVAVILAIVALVLAAVAAL